MNKAALNYHFFQWNLALGFIDDEKRHLLGATCSTSSTDGTHIDFFLQMFTDWHCLHSLKPGPNRYTMFFYKNMHIYDTDILNVPGIGFKKNAYTPIFDMISDNLYI